MKILCAFYDFPNTLLRSDPVEELSEHEVTVVHYFDDLQKILNTNALWFHVVLMDMALPKNESSTLRDTTVHELDDYFEQSLIRGVGVFNPKSFKCHTRIKDEFLAVVKSRECWNFDEIRD